MPGAVQPSGKTTSGRTQPVAAGREIPLGQALLIVLKQTVLSLSLFTNNKKIPFKTIH